MSEELLAKDLLNACKNLAATANEEKNTGSEEKARGLWDGVIAMTEVLKAHMDRQKDLKG